METMAIFYELTVIILKIILSNLLYSYTLFIYDKFVFNVNQSFVIYV